MFSFLKFAICALFLLMAVESNAEVTTPEVRIVTEHLPPYQINMDNKLIGGTVGIEMQKLVSKVLPNTNIEVMPWARTYQIALGRPNTVIFSLVRTPEREDKFIWIGKVADVTTELIVLKDSKIDPVKSLDELKNLTIGVKRQDAVATLLSEKGFEYDKNLVAIAYTMSTMRMLERGRIETVPSNQQVIDFYCQTAGCSRSDFKTIYTFKDLSEEFYLAVSLGTDEKLIEQLRSEFGKFDFPVN
ncbi:substrate-binding periplasmic protein [Glaciecola sp. MF2-115]|uniref:substrate-binding periplasmic protein n=1 Tax=Glaciecola sp. MF2-115 TaxID=3384827 RepID=UPI0039A377FA